jgi:OmpA-OmpF porin, OOP family
MALLNILIDDMAAKFGLGGKAAGLVSALLEHIGETGRGGMAAFLERFRSAGLGNAVDSWLSSGENTALEPEQLRQALGEGSLSAIAAKAGVPEDAASRALAWAMPNFVSVLTPGGAIPSMGDILGKVGALPGAAVAESAGSVARYWPILLAFLLTAAVYWFSDKPMPAPAPVAEAPKPALPAKLNYSFNDGIARLTGVVPTEAIRQSLLDKLKQLYGDKVQVEISVDPAVSAPAWIDKILGYFDKLNISGAELSLEGSKLRYTGPGADALKAWFGTGFDYEILAPLAERAGDIAREATEKSIAALNSLQKGFTPEQLVSALNLSIINFASGKSIIPAESMKLIDEAAEAFRQAPAGTVVEVGGHTDTRGNPAANAALSMARATAVRNALVAKGVAAAMLQVKGYGGTQPKAGNDTEEGRFQNRRIEYKQLP